jgi:hypothetical protein
MAALVLTATLLAAGCGGGGDDDGGSSADTKASTTSTTLGADPTSAQLAKDAQITTADLGAGWKEYRAGEEPSPFTEKCGGVGELRKNVPGGTTTQGPIHQYGDQSVFVQSTVIVFKDDAAAQEYVTRRTSDDYLECFRKSLEKSQKKSDKKLTVVISKNGDPNIGTGGLEGTTRYAVMSGDQEMAAIYRDVWRFGRTIVLEGTDLGQSDDPNIGTVTTDATTNAITAVQRRLTPTG